MCLYVCVPKLNLQLVPRCLYESVLSRSLVNCGADPMFIGRWLFCIRPRRLACCRHPVSFAFVYLLVFVCFLQKPVSELMSAIQLGINHSVGGLYPKPMRDLLYEDFHVVETHNFPK